MDIDGEGKLETLERAAPGGMKLVCAWHVANFGYQKVMREATPGHEQDGVSHGICAECMQHRAGHQRNA